jgi:hypothetical protein
MTVADVWDSNSEPDIELGLWCPSTETSVTDVMPKVQDSTTPSWSSGGCTMTANELTTVGFDFDALDIDLTGADVVVGRTRVVAMPAQLQAGSVSGSVGTISRITFTFTRQ